MSNPFYSASPSKKRKGRPVVVNSESSDVYQFCFVLFSLSPTFSHRELVEAPATPIKKRLLKTTPHPGSDDFNAVSTRYPF